MSSVVYPSSRTVFNRLTLSLCTYGCTRVLNPWRRAVRSLCRTAFSRFITITAVGKTRRPRFYCGKGVCETVARLEYTQRGACTHAHKVFCKVKFLKGQKRTRCTERSTGLKEKDFFPTPNSSPDGNSRTLCRYARNDWTINRNVFVLNGQNANGHVYLKPQKNVG